MRENADSSRRADVCMQIGTWKAKNIVPEETDNISCHSILN